MPNGVAPQTLTLQSSSSAYNVTTNSTAGLSVTDMGANGGDTINASAGQTVNAGGMGANGNWDVINISNGAADISSNENILITGNNDPVSAGASGSLTIQGTGDTVTSSNNVIALSSSVTGTMTVIGDGDTIYGHTGDTLTVGGNGMNGNGDVINMASG